MAKTDMSEATKEKLESFVAAMLQDGYEYSEIQRFVQQRLAVHALKKQRNVTKAAALVGVTGMSISNWLRSAGLEPAEVLRESA